MVQDVWRRKREREENKRKWICLYMDSFIIFIFVVMPIEVWRERERKDEENCWRHEGVRGRGGELG